MTRVLVTGLGAVTPIGSSVPEYLTGLLTGRRGITTCQRYDTTGLRSRLAAAVPEFPTDPDHPDPGVMLAIRAGREALADGQVHLTDDQRWRAGLVLGTCLGGLHSIERYVFEGRSPQILFGVPSSVVTQQVATALGLLGESRTSVTACSAGTNAIGIGLNLIRSNRCDLVLAGGTDPLCASPAAGFSVLEALDPEVCRPFDEERSGISIGEGAGMLLLESEESALARGAQVYAEVRGYGVVNDGYHVTAPDPTGQGALRAMESALADAGISSEAITYINAHGTGTRVNDEMELLAVTRLLKDRRVPVSSTKSQVGHTMGAAGSVEAVACCLAIAHQFLPSTVTLQRSADPSWDFVPEAGRTARVGLVLSNSFAFGGNMACLVFTPYRRETGRRCPA